MGGFKAALAALKQDANAVDINCAGRKLHAFLPATRAPFDALRATDRVYDLEWDDSESFELPLADIRGALQWATAQRAAGRHLVISCAQGKSRSGAMATAYLMATRDIDADAALALIRARRPFVQPNSGFMKRLRAMAAEIRAVGRESAPSLGPSTNRESDGGS